MYQVITATSFDGRTEEWTLPNVYETAALAEKIADRRDAAERCGAFWGVICVETGVIGYGWGERTGYERKAEPEPTHSAHVHAWADLYDDIPF